MQFIDLKKQYSLIKDEIDSAVINTLESGNYIFGPEVNRIEENLSEYTGFKYTISCASGTDALVMAMMAYEIGPGDLVITTPFTFISSAECIGLVGATPIFVDISKESFNLCPDALEKCITDLRKKNQLSKLKAVISVDLFGLPAEYSKIEKILNEHDVPLIADCAQSFGSRYGERKSCNYGNIMTTSFFPAKPLGCYGDGGAVFTDDEELNKKLKSIRVHGMGEHKYENVRLGITGRLDAIQAAVLNVKIKYLDQEIIKRNSVASAYNRQFEQLNDLIKPSIKPNITSAWAQYTLMTDKREAIVDHLKSRDIPINIYYPIPLHMQKVFKYLNYQEGDFPITEECAKKAFSLPMHPYLSNEDQEKIVVGVKDFFDERHD